MEITYPKFSLVAEDEFSSIKVFEHLHTFSFYTLIEYTCIEYSDNSDAKYICFICHTQFSLDVSFKRKFLFFHSHVVFAL